MSEVKKKVRRKASRREKKDWIAGYVFIAPVTIGLLVFYVFPFIQNFWFSFNDVNKFNMATFCGISNYQRLFQEPDLMLAMKNTLLYAVVTVPIGLALSLLVASLLNSKIKGTSFYRTIYFLPSNDVSSSSACMETDLPRRFRYFKYGSRNLWNRGAKLAYEPAYRIVLRNDRGNLGKCRLQYDHTSCRDAGDFKILL